MLMSVVPYHAQNPYAPVMLDVFSPGITDGGRVGGHAVDQLCGALVNHRLLATLLKRKLQNIAIISALRHRDDILQEYFLHLGVGFVQYRAQAVAVLSDGQSEEQAS